MYSTMLKLLFTLLFFAYSLRAQQVENSDGIRCPEISCQHHDIPDVNCRVQSYFIYRGTTCKGCVEDACATLDPTGQGNHNVDSRDHHHGMSSLRDRLPGVSHIMSGMHNIRPVGNRMVIINPANFILRNARLLQLLATRRPVLNTAAPSIRCPKLHCHDHHQPEPHCIVNSYFMYRDNRCPGCQEDICLGATSVPDSLVGERQELIDHTHKQIFPPHETLHSQRPPHPWIRNHMRRNFRHLNGRGHMRNRLFHGQMHPTPTAFLLVANRHELVPSPQTMVHRNLLENERVPERSIGGQAININDHSSDKHDAGTSHMNPDHSHQDHPVAPVVKSIDQTPSSSTGIRCPELSCHLHQTPRSDCRVQTFFVYHGVTCKSCVEDVCLDNAIPANHHLEGDQHQHESISGSHGDCPNIKCHTHHTPDPHCIVETYFMYREKRCRGCDEDICLGAQAVPESLVGDNVTGLHVNGDHSQHSPSMAMTDSRSSAGIVPVNNINHRESESGIAAKQDREMQPVPIGRGKGLSGYTGRARSYLQGLFHPLFSRTIG